MLSPNDFVYWGRSMKGTFRFGDHLITEHVSMDDIIPGDILVYRRQIDPSGKMANIVHRVMARMPFGLIMRGDSNPANDINLVQEEYILGRVVGYRRNKKLHSIKGGGQGMLFARFCHSRYATQRFCTNLFWRFLVFIGRRPYRWLRRSGLTSRVWKPKITKIDLSIEGGAIVKFVHGNQTVACWWPGTGRFTCRKPYDLVLNLEKLTCVEPASPGMPGENYEP